MGSLMLVKGVNLWRQERRLPPGIYPGKSGTMPLPQVQIACRQCGQTTLRPGASFCPSCGAPRVIAQRYRVLSSLGQGGMGTVYLVADQHLSDKQLAVKEVSDMAIPNPGLRRQAISNFQKEAELLSRLDHPNLPRVVDFLSQAPHHYLVMDYVEGITLEKLLVQRNQPFPEDKVLEWAGQLCTVLTYLHSQKPPVIFRDLKPDNIMLTHSGYLKLIDFGIARIFKPGQSGDTTKLGTPGYAPPEQYGGQGQTDARSDIYALGVTMHRLLTLYDPTDTPFNLPPVRRLNAAVSTKVEQIIERATFMEPRRRYQTTAEMKQAL
jgi:serine/threonine-protein kinase